MRGRSQEMAAVLDGLCRVLESLGIFWETLLRNLPASGLSVRFFSEGIFGDLEAIRPPDSTYTHTILPTTQAL